LAFQKLLPSFLDAKTQLWYLIREVSSYQGHSRLAMRISLHPGDICLIFA
jgi:hypothetical protein